MGLYSTLLDHDAVSGRLQPFDRVLMVVCPGCACESIAWACGGPCRALHAQGNAAEAVNRVRQTWVSELTAQGKQVRSVTVAFPCEMFDSERAQITEALGDAQAVAVLACSGGSAAVQQLIREQGADNVRVIPLMRTAGTFSLRLVKDETGEYSVVDKAHSRVTLFGHADEGKTLN